MSVAQLEALYNAASAALEAADYSTAIAKAMQLKLRLAATPNLTRSAGGGEHSMEWANVAGIDAFIAECRKLQTAAAHASAGPIRQSKVAYARPESTGEDW